VKSVEVKYICRMEDEEFTLESVLKRTKEYRDDFNRQIVLFNRRATCVECNIKHEEDGEM